MRPAPTHPFLDWPGPIAFAHRGGASDNPENTMPAFQHAVDLGYTYLETDVHATNDGVLVAFHDADLSRTTDRPGTINSLPWREVQRARVAGREQIPLFQICVGSFPDHRFNIDCKTNRRRRPDRLAQAPRLPRPRLPRQLQRHPPAPDARGFGAGSARALDPPDLVTACRSHRAVGWS